MLWELRPLLLTGSGLLQTSDLTAKSKRATRLGRAVEGPPGSLGRVGCFQDFKSLSIGAGGRECHVGGFMELYRDLERPSPFSQGAQKVKGRTRES